jgi:hypothetical protein
VGPTSIDDAAAGWVRQVQRGRRAGARLGPGRYLEVRYEDLVSSSEETLRAVCGFLDLPWSDELLGYTDRADDVLRDVALPGNQQGIRLAPTKGLRSWETEMPTPTSVASRRSQALSWPATGTTSGPRRRSPGR